VVAGIGLATSAVVFWPGVVDQDDLDAKAANVLPAVGVAIAAGMTIVVAVRGGVERWQPARHLDWFRVALGVGVIFVALPWLLADLGISLDGIPVLGSIWQTGELRTQPGDPVVHSAVHHGHHHGMDGTLLLWSALLLSRTLPAFGRRALGRVTAVLLSLMLAYGLAEIANDAWLEQIVKRGWTDWEIPDMTRPSVSLGWLAIFIGTVLVYVVWFGRDEPAGERDDAGALSSRPANTPS
jgi:Mn2+/Fe2+ NRAMP family transporter